jgi:hypothetical protein
VPATQRHIGIVTELPGIQVTSRIIGITGPRLHTEAHTQLTRRVLPHTFLIQTTFVVRALLKDPEMCDRALCVALSLTVTSSHCHLVTQRREVLGKCHTTQLHPFKLKQR